MQQSKTHSVEERIVSISQPHVRPIVRGKASAKVEFSAKVAGSRVRDCFWIEKQSWNNFNEGTELIPAIERYQQRHGCYPEVRWLINYSVIVTISTIARSTASGFQGRSWAAPGPPRRKTKGPPGWTVLPATLLRARLGSENADMDLTGSWRSSVAIPNP